MVAIGEAARLSGVGIETIRYYEREGIVPRPGRTANNRRVYGPGEIGRLRMLRQCRNLGFSLSDAKLLLDLSDQPAADCGTVYAMAEAQIAAVRAKIADLKKLEVALQELTLNCGSGSVACPMLEQLRKI